MNSTPRALLVQSQATDASPGLITGVTAEEAGWELLNMDARRLAPDARWSHNTGDCEAVVVVLGGRCKVSSNRGTWPRIGRRPNVFSGMPYALYLPPHSDFTLTALDEGVELAHCWVPADEDHEAQLITPEQSKIEIRGGLGATRQINSILPPGFACQRIVCVEVYTPGGNWSSYPPHKHDVHRENEDGTVVEAKLEEIYYYKIDKPKGYALQRVYTDDRSLDEVVVAHDNDLVLVPRGYHPVSAAYGYSCYYLNFLAGSAQSLANSDDPDYAWVKETWTGLDPRLPLVNHGMEGRP